MPRIEFLVDVPGFGGNAATDVRRGDVLEVSADVAKKWADGERAVLVRRDRSEKATR